MLTDDKVFQLFMERFDRVDEDNRQIQTDLKGHVEADNKVHAVVIKHAAYWKLALAVGSAVAATGLSLAAALIH